MPQIQGGIRELYRSFVKKDMSIDDNLVTFMTELEVLAKYLSSKGCVITQKSIFHPLLERAPFSRV